MDRVSLLYHSFTPGTGFHPPKRCAFSESMNSLLDYINAMVMGYVALRLYTLPRRSERSTLISVLQTGHFNCRKPLAVPNLNARIFLQFSQRTAARGVLSFSVSILMRLLSLPLPPAPADCAPVSRAAPCDKREQSVKLEGNLPCHRNGGNWFLSIYGSTDASFR